jgi:hypothetical protein
MKKTRSIVMTTGSKKEISDSVTRLRRMFKSINQERGPWMHTRRVYRLNSCKSRASELLNSNKDMLTIEEVDWLNNLMIEVIDSSNQRETDQYICNSKGKWITDNKDLSHLDGATEMAHIDQLLQDIGYKRLRFPTHEHPINMIAKSLDNILKEIPYREREIIKLLYGIGDGYIYTIQEVARIFKTKRGEIARLRKLALKKLDHPMRAKKLKGITRYYWKD